MRCVFTSDSLQASAERRAKHIALRTDRLKSVSIRQY
jgi:hypothetical protein